MMYFALLFLVVFVYVLEKLLYYGAELKDKSNEKKGVVEVVQYQPL